MTVVARAGPEQLVTPVILTFNEESNIGRLLRSLQWARDVVIVDSGSDDGTERIARQFANVRWFVRRFDTHGAQWEYAIRRTGVATRYVLALDADYEVPASFAAEVGAGFAPGRFAGAVAAFEYRIHGRPLLGSVYPPKLVVFNPAKVQVSQPGHSQKFRIEGPIYRFHARLIHDDRKPLKRFLESQLKYASLEAIRLRTGASNHWRDRLRRLGVMPPLAALATYLKAGGPLGGSAALRYVYERTLCECVLALQLLDHQKKADDPAEVEQQARQRRT
jgi:hypothetical protein